MEHTFATCLSCIDGRTLLPAINWIKENYHVDYVDMITEMGMDGVLSSEDPEIDNIITKTKFSIEKHNSNHIFVVGHHDCGKNVTTEEMHKKHIEQAVKKLNHLGIPGSISGLWISRQWQVNEITKL